MSTSGKLYPVSILLALMVVTCTEYDPVAVDDASQELIEQERFLPFANRDGPGREAVGGAEPYRHRLSVNLSFDGALVPHETVTLRLEGVATENLTGGEVRVMMPTVAAMDHAGASRSPSYPAGKKIPAVARWNVPAMDAGETWSRSVEIALPEPGYYQVAVMANSQAPDDRDPFVLDVADIERWLLVMDGGGLVTHSLDPDAMPEGVIAGEGPFRQAPASVSSPNVNAYGGGDLSFHVVYYESGARRNAKDAKIRIDYLDQGDDVVRTFKVTVPSDGMVTADCPEPFEYVVAKVYVPVTDETSGQYLIGGTEVYRSDCGTTRTLISDSYIFIPWRNLNEVIPKMERYFGQYRSAIEWVHRREVHLLLAGLGPHHLRLHLLQQQVGRGP